MAASGVCARETLGGMLAGPGVYGIPGAATGGGYGASSCIFTVGATRGGSEVGIRAPQPPQNRESTSLSVPQDGQRIP
jgi:outer membrane lipoprotein SlyB